MIDTHTHIDLISDDPAEQDKVVAEAIAEGINLMINIGVDEARLTSCKALSERNISVYHTAGFHPEVLNEVGAKTDIALIEEALKHPKCIGIGEIGLDYFHNKENKETQKELFIKQLDLAVKTRLPVSLHIRDAWEDSFAVLEPYKGKIRGIFHCFTGTVVEAERCLDIGFYVSFAGMLTYKNADPIREAAQFVPVERSFLETDAPFLAPVPMRGKPNRPAYVKHLYEFYAQLKGLSLKEIEQVHENEIRGLFRKIMS